MLIIINQPVTSGLAQWPMSCLGRLWYLIGFRFDDIFHLRAAATAPSRGALNVILVRSEFPKVDLFLEGLVFTQKNSFSGRE
jgi:hypothetical protein